jgi:hypothetical protein
VLISHSIKLRFIRKDFENTTLVKKVLVQKFNNYNTEQ